MSIKENTRIELKRELTKKVEVENKTYARITGKAQREERRLWNARALREAIINAILHNDYTTEAPPKVEGLLRVLNAAMDRQEIQENLQLSDRENFRINYLKPALDAGLIEMTIPDKPNSKLQKYRLTALGEQSKKELIRMS